jgi:rod shape-determining protein MreB and related proteins
VGDEGAEAVKLAIGSAWPVNQEAEAEIRGRDLATGLLRRVTLTAEDVREALRGPVDQIVEALKGAFERAPAELAADVMKKGLVLVGGGALLRGIEMRFQEETGLAVTIADAPLTCVAVGAGMSLEEPMIDLGPRRPGRRRR